LKLRFCDFAKSAAISSNHVSNRVFISFRKDS